MVSDPEDTLDVDPLSRTVVTEVSEGRERGTAAGEDACLVIIYGAELGRRIRLGIGMLTIGRSSKADIQLDQESVSRHHCRIGTRRGKYWIEDLGSTNGTTVNDEVIQEEKLRDGDQIKVGRTILKFIIGNNIESQYHEEIYRVMTMDALTGVYNKRYFDEALEKEVSRTMRYGRTFSLIVFDIDHFKSINDTYGHLAGDHVLRQLGSVVTGLLRRDDIVARIGGEEFAIITPEVEAEQSAELAEKLRSAVESTAFSFEGQDIDVTISLGVADWKASMKRPEDLVAVADEMLYNAKRSGRNRVCT